jgi:hypothetical protein
MSHSRFVAITAILLASGCQYRRDCSSPVRRTMHVDPELVDTAKVAANEWRKMTGGGETINILTPIFREIPIAGETNVRFGPTPPGTSGIYYPHHRTAFIHPQYRLNIDVMMHELGHAMTVPHHGGPDTIMHPSIIGLNHDPATCNHLCCLP